MTIFIAILLGIIGLILLLLILGLFLRKSYTVQVQTEINQPCEVVFEYIRFIRNQDHFNKWVMADPNSLKSYKGEDGSVGFVYAWESKDKKVGQGEQEIKNITPAERVQYEIRFIKPYPGLAQAYMITKAISENKTRINWGFYSSMRYPMNIMLALFRLDKMLEKDMRQSLDTLKKILEK